MIGITDWQRQMSLPQPRFLLDESFDLVYAPSLLSWRCLPAATASVGGGRRRVPGREALAGVKKDLANLQAVFGPSVKKVIDGDDACASAAKKLLTQRGLLFFGAHCLNLADQPLESHLLLPSDETETPGEVNDGRLTAA